MKFETTLGSNRVSLPDCLPFKNDSLSVSCRKVISLELHEQDGHASSSGAARDRSNAKCTLRCKLSPLQTDRLDIATIFHLFDVTL